MNLTHLTETFHADALAALRQHGVVAIVRTKDSESALANARLLLESGLRVLEVALTTPGALGVITQLRAEAADDVLIGAGTVTDLDAAKAAIEAGAQFLVSPNVRADVIELAGRHGVATIPGCLTPTEMVDAMTAGATAVKIFPAHLWTPSALAGMLEALPQLACVPTGGVSPETAPDWIAAGAVAVGMGASLTKADDPAAQARTLQAAIAGVRAP
jgi:2-dehydro-3-deoxyphosphogluconate aldolase/(4S)-4-hydroxy-2-oxoglutarate aldolase